MSGYDGRANIGLCSLTHHGLSNMGACSPEDMFKWQATLCGCLLFVAGCLPFFGQARESHLEMDRVPREVNTKNCPASRAGANVVPDGLMHRRVWMDEG